MNIGGDMFRDNSDLTEIVIPASVTNIGAYAFANCSSLRRIVMLGNAPSVGENAFMGVHEDCAAHVRRDSVGWDVDIPGAWNGIAIQYFDFSDIIRFYELEDIGWTIGTNGTAAAYVSNEAPMKDGRSICFTADDMSATWIETTVTNPCRVVFDWRCSCEPLVKEIQYDYASFIVDGENMAFICGETDWTNQVFHITGNGEHRLRWMFQRDEDGTSGDDSAWVANIVMSPAITIEFLAGGAPEGNVPETITCYANDTVILPDAGTLAWYKHHFIGWGDGDDVYQAGAKYTLRETGKILVAVWEENEPETFGEYVNAPELLFTTGGDAEWMRVRDESTDGYSLRSGAITHSQTSRIETIVSEAGTIRFSYKVSGEIVKRIVFDGLAFCIDGVQQGGLMGDSEWTEASYAVDGEGPHTLSWLYVKDYDGSVGADCAWIDEVKWLPVSSLVTVIDVGGGKSVAIPNAWFDGHADALASYSGDKVAYADSIAANGRLSVVECYVLGLDPDNETNDFKIVSFPMKADGTPDLEHIVFEPAESKWNVTGAKAVVKGAETLGGEWHEVDKASEADRAKYRFYKVVVELP